MRRQSLLRLGMYIGGIILIFLVLGLSLMRLRLYTPSSDDVQSRANFSVENRLQELRAWPPAPDHPLYPLLMLRDQIRLKTTPADRLPLLKLELGLDRLQSAKLLLGRKRTSLALTTLTKSTKYVLSAAADASALSPQSSSLSRGEVRNAITIQIAELNRLKQYFSDEQKPVIDGLISQLIALQASFL